MKKQFVAIFLAFCFVPKFRCSDEKYHNDESAETRWNRYAEFLRFYGGGDAISSGIDPKDFTHPGLSENQPNAPIPPPPALPGLPDLNITAPKFFCFNYNLTSINFTCDHLERSNPRPTSVHRLRPSDIDVIAAMGDSITAGNGAGADCLLEVIIMGRDLTFSIGGRASLEDGALTLANILRTYNPNITGYSLGSGPASSIEKARLNVAIPGARSRDMLDQAEVLIGRMKNMTDVDYDNDWKMVTLFIGGNDLCACSDISAKEFANNIKEALDLMHSEMPRTFVNVVQVILVTEINKLTTPDCHLAHGIYCPCAKEFYNTDWKDVFELTKAYHRAVEDMILYGQFDTRDDFTVVIQPFFEETYIRENDHNILSPDCFHLSEFGHQISAMSLWNNLIEPAGQKRKAWNYGDVVECPGKPGKRNCKR
ncbi:phospholipase B1, membrane-associated-like [Ptychodera flava]|uniref:phospholipase B1, membrane-associated-like n=1 Tax=Ptychodera flava TaxID=63121 RepID=UPI00396A697F